MKKVLFATGNESKAKRFKKGLLENDIEIITLNDIENNIDIEENGKDAIENALIKARAYANVYDLPVFAMDDNLYIDDIPKDKQPGMYVRRVNGKRLNDNEMIEYYSNLAHEYGKDGKLTCRWVYGIAVIKDGKEFDIYFNQIAYIEYSLRDTTIYLNNNSKIKLSEKSLSLLSKELDDRFYQINRNIIINLDMEPIYNKGTVKINHNEFQVSRRNQKDLKIKILERSIYNARNI